MIATCQIGYQRQLMHHHLDTTTPTKTTTTTSTSTRNHPAESRWCSHRATIGHISDRTNTETTPTDRRLCLHHQHYHDDHHHHLYWRQQTLTEVTNDNIEAPELGDKRLLGGQDDIENTVDDHVRPMEEKIMNKQPNDDINQLDESVRRIDSLSEPATTTTSHYCHKQLSPKTIIYLSSTCLVVWMLLMSFQSRSGAFYSPSIIVASALDYWPKFGGQHRPNHKLLLDGTKSGTSKPPLMLHDGTAYHYRNYFVPTSTTTAPRPSYLLGDHRHSGKTKPIEGHHSAPTITSGGKTSMGSQSSLLNYYHTVMDRYKLAMSQLATSSNSLTEPQISYRSSPEILSQSQPPPPPPSLPTATTTTATTKTSARPSSVLGSPCRYSRDCRQHIENAHCDGDTFTCACLPYHVPLNSTVCLAPALLGYSCQIGAQCTKKVPNSQCLEGTCQCQQDFVPHRKDKCLQPALVNDYCLKDEQCRLNDKYSHCKWIIPHIYGKCRCPMNHLVSGSHCSPRLGDECKQDEHCKMATKNSYCQRPTIRASRSQFLVPRCACKPDYEISADKMFCNARATTSTTPTATTTTTTTTTTATAPTNKPARDGTDNLLADKADQQIDVTSNWVQQKPTTQAPTTTTTTITTSSPINSTTSGEMTSETWPSDTSHVKLASVSTPPTENKIGGQPMDSLEKEKNKYEIIVSVTDDTSGDIVNVEKAGYGPPRLANISSQPEMSDEVMIQTSVGTTSTTATSSAVPTLLSSRAPETIGRLPTTTMPSTTITTTTTAATTTTSTLTPIQTSPPTTTNSPAPSLSTKTTTASATSGTIPVVSSNVTSEPEEYRPTSLGKRCNHRMECQSRDPYSDCIDGVCECQRPTSECSAKATGCFKDTFQCRNGQCISWYFVCDKFKNCDDGSDEDECRPHRCPKEAFQCDDGTCLSRNKVCNGHWECPDGSDEAHCYKGISCDPKAFRCQNGQCLPQYVFCNAVEDCVDGSDEIEETCENNNMAQVSAVVVSATSRQKKYHKKIMGNSSLGRASDDQIALYRNASAKTTGESMSFRCPDTSSSYTCANGKCRSTAILCSGVDGCGDGSDEDRCEVCSCEPPLAPISSMTLLGSRPKSRRGRL